ncbi:MAG: THUMP domain-containing protein [Halobacteria archaeon]|nr:THUMP domain-containing protein [Halobacteria archaeon]
MYLLELKSSNHELALAEARSVGDVYETARGVAVCKALDLERAKRLGMSHRVLRYMAKSDASLEGVLRAVETCEYAFSGSFSVRARGVEETEIPVGTETLERKVGSVIHERGHEVDLEDPDNEFRLVFTDDRCYFGKVVVDVSKEFSDRPTDKPFFKPGSMSPMLARTLANIAGAGKSRLVLDPMCGTGGVLVEGGLVGSEVVGFDSDRQVLRGAETNLREYLESDGWHLGAADASRLPLRESSVDCAVTDFPYGRASSVDADSVRSLAENVLDELSRVVSDGGRCVVVCDRWLVDEAEAAGFEVVERLEDRVHKSLTRRILALESKK